MSEMLVVIGSTGQQGRSIVSHVVNDPRLSTRYSIRAVTRDPSSSAAKELDVLLGVTVVKGDVDDRASLDGVFAGASAAFIMTMPHFEKDGQSKEFQTGKRMVDAAIDANVKFIIFSTLPSFSELSNGKYTGAIHFEAKAKIEKYIRSRTEVHSAFISPGFFMQNLSSIPFLAPQPARDGSYAMNLHMPGDSTVPMIDANDIGKFVNAILAQPEKFSGQVLATASETLSWAEVAKSLSTATGKQVSYNRISEDDFRAALPFGQDVFPEVFSSAAQFGYYGRDDKAIVAEAVTRANGRPLTLKEHLARYPPLL